MNKEYKLAIKSIVFGQSFVDTLDQFKGSNAFKHQLKNKGNQFSKEVERFLNTAYNGGQTETNLLHLIEACEKAIDEVIENQVELVE